MNVICDIQFPQTLSIMQIKTNIFKVIILKSDHLENGIQKMNVGIALSLEFNNTSRLRVCTNYSFAGQHLWY